MASLLDATRSLWSSVLNAGAARKPASPPERPSRLKFAEPCATTHAVEPAPRELRDEVWWTARDYAEIRQKQRALALEALRQARAAPAGTTPPPIPGESRRGLGVCCELSYCPTACQACRAWARDRARPLLAGARPSRDIT